MLMEVTRWINEDQHPLKVNVWAGIVSSEVIGHYLRYRNLIIDSYHNLLVDTIIRRNPYIVGSSFNTRFLRTESATTLGQHICIQMDRSEKTTD